ncbi:hypothetical protein EON78_05310 [bacterium]|nr:MAG: hypothetical protein EON78_05310 [bacterium]
MAEYYAAHESIECDKCEIITRKYVPSIPIKDPDLGMGIKYNLSRNASAQILGELNPKKHKKNATSRLNLNDIIRAESISAFVVGIKRLEWNLAKHSHTHKGSDVTFNLFCFAQIKYPLHNLIKALEEKNQKLIKNK